jgi:DNA excision repair protein ERCC-6-like 2
MIERKKEVVLAGQLPEKNEQVIFCELSPLQKEVYEHIVRLPDFELVKKGNAPCGCGINRHFFKKFRLLSSRTEQLEYYRTNKKEITSQSKCCRAIPWNPRKDEPGEPEIDPDAVIWRTLDAHYTGDGASNLGCKQCPWCCTFPCLRKLIKLSSHLALLQAQKSGDSEVRGSPAHVKYTKDREFAKVALVGVVNRLPGRDFDRSDSIMDDHFSLSGKLKVLDTLLTKYYLQGGRVLLFAHSTQLLDLIEHWLKSLGTFEYRRMDGQTATGKRQELAEEYNRDSSIFLFLLSIKATGLGLTLTVSSDS